MSKVFNDDILTAIMRRYDKVDRSESGSLLFGHMPSVAPSAYETILYSGCTNYQIDQEKKRSALEIPSEYIFFLKQFNGMSLMNGTVKFLGIVHHPIEYTMNPLNYPSSINHYNSSGKSNVKFNIGYNNMLDDNILINSSGEIYYSKNLQKKYNSLEELILSYLL